MAQPETQQQDYFDTVHRKTWMRRTASFMAGTTLGIISGAAIGLVAAFVPSLLVGVGIAEAAAALTPLIVAQSVAAFAAVGALMGFAALAAEGSDAAAVSSAFEEKERRDREAGVAVSPGVQKEQTAPAIFNWKAAAITVPAAAGVGALLAVGGIGLGPATMGFAASSPAGVVASAASFGMFGSLLAQPYAHYLGKLTKFYSKVLEGKAFSGDEPAQEASKSSEVVQNQAVALAPQQQPDAPKRRFTTEKTSFTFQGMVEKTEEHAHDTLPPR